MWVARDKEGYLMFWDCDEKPQRICGNTWACDVRGVGYLQYKDLFTDLKWEDVPIEVEINEKIDSATLKDAIFTFEIDDERTEIFTEEQWDVITEFLDKAIEHGYKYQRKF